MPNGVHPQGYEMWDVVLQSIGLDATFYEGASVLLFPPEWLNRASVIAARLDALGKKRQARAIGVDPAEGGDSSVWSVVDELGVIELLSIKTPDTSVIPTTTMNLMQKYRVPAENVVFDRGGGGKQHADALRKLGQFVRTVAFGESANAPMKPFNDYPTFQQLVDEAETTYIYPNRRVQMYHLLRLLIDPTVNEIGFGIPEEFTELRKQLAPIPLNFDDEGKVVLPSKSRSRTGEPSLVDLIGHSPDEADATVLAVYIMLYPQVSRQFVGAVS